MIVIVGAGIAGLTAAQTLRELGYEGDIRLFSDENDCPYERPVLSKGFIADVSQKAPPLLSTGQALAEAQLDLKLNSRVVAIDRAARTIALADGELASYDELLLTCGARPRRLRVPGAQFRGVHYLRNADDARALRRELRPAARVVVIGGGVIGLEIAASAMSVGALVTVIEAASCVMGRVVPVGFAERIQAFHELRGIRVQTDTLIAALEDRDGDVCGVRLIDGEFVEADVVVVGIGVEPRDDLAVQAGLEVANGIKVDDHFRTSDERIFAAGDVAQVLDARSGHHVRLEHWQAGLEQGRAAAASIMGSGEPYAPVPWMWSDQHDLHIQATGFGFEETDQVIRGDIDDRSGLIYFGTRDHRLVAACGAAHGTGVARVIRAARTLIDRQAELDPAQLADQSVDLRRIARAVA